MPIEASKWYARLLAAAAVLGVMPLACGPLTALAVPPAPLEHILTQPDGTPFAARQWGDEWLHGWETIEGYTIVPDPVSGYWVYADRAPTGELVPSTSRVGLDPRPAILPERIRPLAPALRSQVIGRRREASQRVVPPSGVANIPVILITFQDTEPTYSASDFEALLFDRRPPIATGPGSMRDYYEEISYGTFTVSSGPNGVQGWFRASNQHDYYGNQYGVQKAAELVKEAVLAADPFMDFSWYDNDGDGRVDVVMVVHQGTGAEASGNPTDIWSHRWSLSGAGVGAVILDGVTIDDYVIQPEILFESISTIGVFAHEFGHALGLPDLYDTDDSSEGIGNWGLMGSGSWNRTSRFGDTPAHMMAWSKWLLGWLTPTPVSREQTDYTLPAVSSTPFALQMLDNPGGPEFNRNTGARGEYFLLENRQREGFDYGLPSAGLLIWHIDESKTGNQDEYHKLVDLEEADGRADLDAGRNRGDAGDPFPGDTGKRAFDPATNPDSLLYDGTDPGIWVSYIGDPGNTMVARFGFNSPPVAHGGPDRFVTPGIVVYLDGSKSYDPDVGDRVTSYRWRLDTRPAGSAVSWVDSYGPDPSVTFRPDVPGTYVVSLVVRDSHDFESVPDTVIVEAVHAYATPNPASSSATFIHSANVSGGTVRIYNVAGRRVATFALEADGSTTWNLTDSTGWPLASGLYLWLLFDKDGKPVLSRPERLVIQR